MPIPIEIIKRYGKPAPPPAPWSLGRRLRFRIEMRTIFPVVMALHRWLKRTAEKQIEKENKSKR